MEKREKSHVTCDAWLLMAGFIDHRWVVYRPQINTDWHRLRAKGSDLVDY